MFPCVSHRLIARAVLVFPESPVSCFQFWKHSFILGVNFYQNASSFIALDSYRPLYHQTLHLVPSVSGLNRHSIHSNISTSAQKRLPKPSSLAMPNIWHTYQCSLTSRPLEFIIKPLQHFYPLSPDEAMAPGGHISSLRLTRKLKLSCIPNQFNLSVDV